jgi:hypothetical protein
MHSHISAHIPQEHSMHVQSLALDTHKHTHVHTHIHTQTDNEESISPRVAPRSGAAVADAAPNPGGTHARLALAPEALAPRGTCQLANPFYKSRHPCHLKTKPRCLCLHKKPRRTLPTPLNCRTFLLAVGPRLARADRDAAGDVAQSRWKDPGAPPGNGPGVSWRHWPPGGDRPHHRNARADGSAAAAGGGGGDTVRVRAVDAKGARCVLWSAGTASHSAVGMHDRNHPLACKRHLCL